VAIAHLLDRVRRQHPRGIDGARVQLGPIGGVVGLGQRGNLFECRHELTPGFVAWLWQGDPISHPNGEYSAPFGLQRSSLVLPSGNWKVNPGGWIIADSLRRGSPSLGTDPQVPLVSNPVYHRL
jgi:hypothetical protein